LAPQAETKQKRWKNQKNWKTKPKEPSQNHSKTIGKTKKNIVWGHYGQQGQGELPRAIGSPKYVVFCVFPVFFNGFAMVLGQALWFFRFFGFPNGFC